MNKYTINQQLALSDLIFNWTEDLEYLQHALKQLGYDLTIDEMQSEIAERL